MRGNRSQVRRSASILIAGGIALFGLIPASAANAAPAPAATGADLSITTTVVGHTGPALIFDITITNNGPEEATNVNTYLFVGRGYIAVDANNQSHRFLETFHSDAIPAGSSADYGVAVTVVPGATLGKVEFVLLTHSAVPDPHPLSNIAVV